MSEVGMTDREKVIKGLECRLDINGSKYKHCLTCDYRHDIDHCQWACQTDGILEDALALLKAQGQENAIPIDWLMNYAQLPTEYAISEWQKPKKEALIKQIKSRDKPMSFDDALQLVNDQKEATPWQL